MITARAWETVEARDVEPGDLVVDHPYYLQERVLSVEHGVGPHGDQVRYVYAPNRRPEAYGSARDQGATESTRWFRAPVRRVREEA